MVSTVLGTRAGIYRLEGRVLTPLGIAEHDVRAIHALGQFSPIRTFITSPATLMTPTSSLPHLAGRR